MDNGIEYQDDAEKCLFNSLSHILKTNIRDLKNQRLTDEKYREKIQSVANDLLILLLNAKNVTKFDDLENTLNVVNELISMVMDSKITDAKTIIAVLKTQKYLEAHNA